MKAFRGVIAGFFLLWLAVSVILAALGVLWTEATLVQLSVPEVRGLGQYSESVKLDIRAQDGSVMYHQDYSFGGRLSPEDNISTAGYFIELARADAREQVEVPWWEKLFLRLERIDTNTLEGFVAEYYVKSLIEISRLEGIKKEILRLYTLQRLRGVYTDNELYAIFFDSVHYSPKIHGIVGASKAYFNKEFKELTSLETAYLVALVTAGGEGDDDEKMLYHDKVARHYLYELFQSGLISLAEYRAELDRRIEFPDGSVPARENAIVNYILADLNKQDLKIGENTVIVDTFYNAEATNAAIKALEKAYGKDPAMQGAFVMVNVETGGVEVAVGSRVPNSHRNRALSTRRQMGSTFKPIVYATALEQKALPCEQIEDKQYTFIADGSPYKPNNYNSLFMGVIPMRYGLIHSLNNATVLLAQKTGLKKVRQTAVNMGFEGRIMPYHAMALGAFSTTPLNVAQIYTTLANYGQYKEISFISRISDNDNNTIRQYASASGQRAFDSITAYQTMYIMQDVATTGTARGKGLIKGTAAKTGTSDKSKDVWTVAICYPYVIVVWLGYDDFTPIPGDSTGGSIAAPVIADFQKNYFKGIQSFNMDVPEGVTFAPVVRRTGNLAAAGTKGATYTEAFRDGYLPPVEPPSPPPKVVKKKKR